MSSLTETENKNTNIQTNNQKRTKTKHKSKPQKKLNNTHTEKKYSKSFITMISRPDTALTDFVSNLKGYLLQQVQCSSTENHMLDACIQNFFPSFSFV